MTKNQFLDNESLEFHSSQSQSIAEQQEDAAYNERINEVLEDIHLELLAEALGYERKKNIS